jgi:hypothetical protein
MDWRSWESGSREGGESEGNFTPIFVHKIDFNASFSLLYTYLVKKRKESKEKIF